MHRLHVQVIGAICVLTLLLARITSAQTVYGLVRWSIPGPTVDTDVVAGAGVVRRFFSSTFGSFDIPTTGFNVEVGFDVTRWRKNT